MRRLDADRLGGARFEGGAIGVVLWFERASEMVE